MQGTCLLGARVVPKTRDAKRAAALHNPSGQSARAHRTHAIHGNKNLVTPKRGTHSHKNFVSMSSMLAAQVAMTEGLAKFLFHPECTRTPESFAELVLTLAGLPASTMPCRGTTLGNSLLRRVHDGVVHTFTDGSLLVPPPPALGQKAPPGPLAQRLCAALWARPHSKQFASQVLRVLDALLRSSGELWPLVADILQCLPSEHLADAAPTFLPWWQLFERQEFHGPWLFFVLDAMRRRLKGLTHSQEPMAYFAHKVLGRQSGLVLTILGSLRSMLMPQGGDQSSTTWAECTGPCALVWKFAHLCGSRVQGEAFMDIVKPLLSAVVLLHCLGLVSLTEALAVLRVHLFMQASLDVCAEVLGAVVHALHLCRPEVFQAGKPGSLLPCGPCTDSSDTASCVQMLMLLMSHMHETLLHHNTLPAPFFASIRCADFGLLMTAASRGPVMDDALRDKLLLKLQMLVGTIARAAPFAQSDTLVSILLVWVVEGFYVFRCSSEFSCITMLMHMSAAVVNHLSLLVPYTRHMGSFIGLLASARGLVAHDPEQSKCVVRELLSHVQAVLERPNVRSRMLLWPPFVQMLVSLIGEWPLLCRHRVVDSEGERPFTGLASLTHVYRNARQELDEVLLRHHLWHLGVQAHREWRHAKMPSWLLADLGDLLAVLAIGSDKDADLFDAFCIAKACRIATRNLVFEKMV
jgi:hypothetical protein